MKQRMFRNQKQIRINYKESDMKDGDFEIRSNKEKFAVMRDLKATSSAYVVYEYLRGIKKGLDWDLSPSIISELTGMGKNAVRAGIKTLIEKGYLTKHPSLYEYYTFQIPSRIYKEKAKDNEEKEAPVAAPIEDQTQDTMEIDASTGEIIEETNDETDEIIEEAPAEEETDMELSKKTKDQMARIPHHDDKTPIEDDLLAPPTVKVQENDSLSEEEAKRLHDIITRFTNYQLTDNDDKFTLEELQFYADNSSNYTLEDLKSIYTERALYFQYLASEKAAKLAQLEAQIAASMEAYYGKDLTNIVPFPSKGRERIAK